MMYSKFQYQNRQTNCSSRFCFTLLKYHSTLVASTHVYQIINKFWNFHSNKLREYSWTTRSLETITKVVGIILVSKSFLMEKNKGFINISSIHSKLLQFDQGISLREDCQCSITYHRSKSWRAQSLQITYVMGTWWQWRQCNRKTMDKKLTFKLQTFKVQKLQAWWIYLKIQWLMYWKISNNAQLHHVINFSNSHSTIVVGSIGV